MELKVILTSVITSATVSGLLIYILKMYFKARIEHVYKIELEKLKTELAVGQTESEAFVSRRIEAYPAIVEMVYRTRNMSRDLAASLSSRNLSLVSEAATRAKELEELLYHYRIDLERDGQFNAVHRYKNLLLTFTMKASDIKYFIEHQESDRADRIRTELVELYDEIENSYGNIVRELSLQPTATHQYNKVDI